MCRRRGHLCRRQHASSAHTVWRRRQRPGCRRGRRRHPPRRPGFGGANSGHRRPVARHRADLLPRRDTVASCGRPTSVVSCGPPMRTGRNQRQIGGWPRRRVSGVQWAPDGRSILLPNCSMAQTRSPSFRPIRGRGRTLDVGMPAEVPTWGIGTECGLEMGGRFSSVRHSNGFGLFAVRPDGSACVRSRPRTA